MKIEHKHTRMMGWEQQLLWRCLLSNTRVYCYIRHNFLPTARSPASLLKKSLCKLTGLAQGLQGITFLCAIFVAFYPFVRANLAYCLRLNLT